jgi:hypothetical protein
MILSLPGGSEFVTGSRLHHQRRPAMWVVDVFDVRGGYALCGRGKKKREMEVHLCQAPGTSSSAISRDLHAPRAWRSSPSAVAVSQYARR